MWMWILARKLCANKAFYRGFAKSWNNWNGLLWEKHGHRAANELDCNIYQGVMYADAT